MLSFFNFTEKGITSHEIKKLKYVLENIEYNRVETNREVVDEGSLW